MILFVFFPVCATNNWWSLHSDELAILSVYVYTEPSVTMSDTPIFLPIKVTYI